MIQRFMFRQVAPTAIKIHLNRGLIETTSSIHRANQDLLYYFLNIQKEKKRDIRDISVKCGADFVIDISIDEIAEIEWAEVLVRQRRQNFPIARSESSSTKRLPA